MYPCLTLTRGDDYFVADGRQIVINLNVADLPSLTDAIVDIVFEPVGTQTRQVKVAGTILGASDGIQPVQFELPSQSTRRLLPTVDGECYVVITLPSLHKLTPLEGRCRLVVLSGGEHRYGECL